MVTETIDQTSVYTREIVNKSLFHEAGYGCMGALILVRIIPPVGNTKPPNADIVLTTQINKCSQNY